MSEDQLIKLQVMREVNSITNKRIFAHHPDCDQYDHHVFKFGNWAFCVGDTGMYSSLFGLLLINNWVTFTNSLSSAILFILGTLFFIPAIIQLKWKSRRKFIKFIMRVSLGISAFFYLTFCFSKSSWWFRIIMLLIFSAGVAVYSFLHKPNSLPECKNCIYGETYATCLIKMSRILKVKNLELIREDFLEIDYFLKLKEQRNTSRSIE